MTIGTSGKPTKNFLGVSSGPISKILAVKDRFVYSWRPSWPFGPLHYCCHRSLKPDPVVCIMCGEAVHNGGTLFFMSHFHFHAPAFSRNFSSN